MHVGFSGTQEGMKYKQLLKIENIMRNLAYMNQGDILVAHHGDCIGADEDFHKVARGENFGIKGHPPLKQSKRAMCHFDEEAPKKDYIERNHDIVDESEIMIFTPKEFNETLRSGTWATVRYAKKQDKPGMIVFPDGEVKLLDDWESSV